MCGDINAVLSLSILARQLRVSEANVARLGTLFFVPLLHKRFASVRISLINAQVGNPNKSRLHGKHLHLKPEPSVGPSPRSQAISIIGAEDFQTKDLGVCHAQHVSTTLTPTNPLPRPW